MSEGLLTIDDVMPGFDGIEHAAIPEHEPIVQVVWKLHSRCDLECDYCYLYQLGDQSWRFQDKYMSDETIDAAAKQLGEYVAMMGYTTFNVTLHGGEPTLAGVDTINRTVDAIWRESPVPVEFSIQTNALHLDQFLDCFRRNRIRVGISLDGDREANDRHRKYVNGNSSFDQITENIQLMQEDPRYRQLFAGVLAVVDPRNDARRTYDSFRALGAKSIDFMLPHINWDILKADSEPKSELVREVKRLLEPRTIMEQRYGRTFDAPLGRYLADLFDIWFPGDVRQVRVRTFDAMIRGLSGGPATAESLGGYHGGVVVIQPNGEYEMVDTLKSTADAVEKTGLNVREHSFVEVARLMELKARELGAYALAKTCEPCAFAIPCYGGYLPHRYESGSFAHPSVYSPDLAYLFNHIRTRLLRHGVIQN